MAANAPIMLIGSSGQVGFELKRSLAPLGPVIAFSRDRCDLANLEGVRSLIREIRPSIIVNAAAYTAVDRAESDMATATLVNETAVRAIAEEAARIGASVLHYSTDYVFNGDKLGYYTEDDETAPKNAYGRTKRAGEIALQQACPQSVILRTSWVVGAYGANFAKTMLRLAKERESLRIVSDQVGAPTSAALIADVTAHLISRMQRDGAIRFPFGLYHLAAGGETNWHEYARFVIARAGESACTLRLGVDDVEAIGSEEYPTPAARPKNSRLDCSKLKSTFELDLPAWQDGLTQILEQILHK